MTKEILYSSKAKKDIRRIRHDVKKMRELSDVLWRLANGETLEERFRVHAQKGEYKGCLECHIESDFLLVWVDDDSIQVVRVGSHSEVF
ncbi:type II toxin-antitoxin system YafQ family toxin [Palleniella muris]|uniref:Type II toxin-antitoxin system YafQ family toxin n=1 Tax=Palleniella muris TaxID=3038145 RepID=A0AC61QUC8_9BACT|nr:type II toxin-antitoxin system YafQ family toxin [Palleniella muris]TGX84216.1 type II toxin-antitoxin system YafQ family toxin [Palleniella muris]